MSHDGIADLDADKTFTEDDQGRWLEVIPLRISGEVRQGVIENYTHVSCPRNPEPHSLAECLAAEHERSEG
jgi:hypothetical protein